MLCCSLSQIIIYKIDTLFSVKAEHCLILSDMLNLWGVLLSIIFIWTTILSDILTKPVENFDSLSRDFSHTLEGDVFIVILLLAMTGWVLLHCL